MNTVSEENSLTNAGSHNPEFSVVTGSRSGLKLIGHHLFENYLPIRQAYLFDLLGALDRTGNLRISTHKRDSGFT